MENVIFAPYLDNVGDKREIIDGCFGKNGHYPPLPEDEEWSDWNKKVLNKINEVCDLIDKTTQKREFIDYYRDFPNLGKPIGKNE